MENTHLTLSASGGSISGNLSVSGSLSANSASITTSVSADTVNVSYLYATQFASVNRLETTEGVMKFYGTSCSYNLTSTSYTTFNPDDDGLPVRDNAKAYVATAQLNGQASLYAQDNSGNEIRLCTINYQTGAYPVYMIFIPKLSDNSFKVRSSSDSVTWTIRIIGDIL